ncbi:MAG TPA: FecR family protein [Candidatus Elarobacter sp.]
MLSYRDFLRTVAAVIAALVLPFLPQLALAQSDDNAGAGVARISLIEGSLAVQRGDATTPTAAVVNAPVLGGDFLTTGDNTRAEVQISGGTLLRLGDNAQLRFTKLDNDTRAIQLAEGTVELRLLRGTDGGTDIDTPSVTVRPRTGGSYRVTVTHDGQTMVTVRAGDAAIVSPQGDQALTPGMTLFAQGPAASPSITTQEAVALDDFDRFNQDRDVRYEHAVAQDHYVNPDVVGGADLDTYGRWVPDQRYGEVWVPSNVASNWSPYSDGRWVWEDAYGWTWVGNEPWGWAPYHYGAWYHSPSYGWAWYPPPYRTYTPWRPALVAFFTIGNVSVGIGDSIGWVPLAPFEAYHPWWGSGWGGRTTIVNNTVVNNTTIINNYHNAPYGMVTVPGRRFTEGNFAHPTIMRPNELRNVQVARGALPVVPTTANLRYTEKAVPQQLAMRTAFAQRTFAGSPANVQRVPFEQTRTAISAATQAHFQGAGAVRYPTAAARYSGGAQAQPQGAAAVSHQPVAPTDPWSRYGSARGTTIDGAPRMSGRTYGNTGSGAYNATPQRAYGNATTSGGTAPVQRTYGAGNANGGGYTAPQRTYGGGNANSGGYTAPQRTYGGGNANGGGYTAPQRSYGGGNAAPQRSYGGNNGGGYTAPQRSYGGNNGGYSAPQRSNGGGYSAPQRSYGGNNGGGYSAPQRSYGGGNGGGYAAPQRSAQAPQQQRQAPQQRQARQDNRGGDRTH